MDIRVSRKKVEDREPLGRASSTSRDAGLIRVVIDGRMPKPKRTPRPAVWGLE